MNKGFCYQENTHFSQAVKCSREKFWDSVRNASTAWKIDSRREILEAVEQHNSEVTGKWLKNEDYGKFLAKTLWRSFSVAMSLTQRLRPMAIPFVIVGWQTVI